MYTVRITHHPATGKANELRDVLVAHSKASNAEGSPHNVSQLLYAKETTFVNAIRHESLAALEDYGVRNANDPASIARRAKIAPCLDRPQTSELFENLAAAPATGEVNYALRVTYEPALGKVVDLRQGLDKLVSAPIAGVVAKGLATQVAAPDGISFTLTYLFSTLAGLEEFRRASQSDPTTQTFRAQAGNLLAGHACNELHRIWARFTDK